MKTLLSTALVTAALGLSAAPGFAAEAASNKLVPVLLQELATHQNAEKSNQTRLAAFDTLDFDVFTHQKWERLHESHAANILVHWPDGRTTTGIEPHINDLKAMFVYAPDTRIETHPVRVASGEWTAVIGVIEGTFTQPMPIGEGKTIAPTGKRYKLNMATIGHWTPAGVMDEEYLFWDNAAFMKQLGLAQ